MAGLTHTLDEVVRRDRARVVAQLVRVLGSLDAAEESFQEAVLAALATWPARGIPDSPSAWLMTAAKNHARDRFRHSRIAEDKAPLLVDEPMGHVDYEAVADDTLRLVFTCCHPSLSQESQVALTLKVILGFSTDEIARAFLVPEPTIAQRIVRAKRTIEERAVPYEVPGRVQLAERLGAVLGVVYLLFNEGHASKSGALMRLDLQAEALRLSRLLCDLLPDEADVFALFAIVAFGCARAGTRLDAHGDVVLLADQDRSRWDRALVKDGLVSLARARRLGPLGAYVLQASIAAEHIIAPSWNATDWRAIVTLYEALFAIDAAPVVALNRAIALGMLEGADRALRELDALEPSLCAYHYFYAARADFSERIGRDASADYERALALASNDDERRFLSRKLDAIKSR